MSIPSVPPTIGRFHLASPKRRILAIVAANLVLAAVLLLLLETGARVATWIFKIPTSFQPQPFHGFGQTDPVLWWRLQPGLDTEMLGVRLRTNALGFRDDRDQLAAGSVRIFALGDSSTFGWRVDSSEMYTAVAERSLNEKAAGRVSVVSAGVPGYTSFQCLQKFREEIAPLRPDWLVVMASNNESRSRGRGDRELGTLLARKRMLHRWLGFSRAWVLLSRGPEALSRNWDQNPQPGRVANTLGEYQENLRDLIREARTARCRVIFLTMPIRLQLEPSWRHYDRPGRPVAELLSRTEEIDQLGASLEEQAALVEAAQRLRPEQFRAHWMLGQIERRKGHGVEADRQFSLAREGDVHPEAAKPSYNRALVQLCHEEGVEVIDVDRLFRASELGEDALFLDYCHPSPEGHRLIGQELARCLGTLLKGQ